MLLTDFASRISVSIIPDEARLRMVSEQLGLHYVEAAPGEDLDVKVVRGLLDSYGIVPSQMHVRRTRALISETWTPLGERRRLGSTRDT
jgi:hypothetical protein